MVRLLVRTIAAIDMGNTKNLKAINEYKRILRQALDDAGLKGIPLKGFSSWGGNVIVEAKASMFIGFSCEGKQLQVYNYKTNKNQPINLADPGAIEAIKALFKADLKRITEGLRSSPPGEAI